MTPKAFLKLSDDQLRAAGLSRARSRRCAPSSAAMVGGLDLDKLALAPETEVHEALTALPGIGPWSADIYLLFCLGRADAFAAGDLALQIAARAASVCRSGPRAMSFSPSPSAGGPGAASPPTFCGRTTRWPTAPCWHPEKRLDLRGLSVPRTHPCTEQLPAGVLHRVDMRR